MAQTGIKILLVEDNPGDIRLTQETFLDAGLTNKLDVVNDGEEALAYLGMDLAHPEAPLTPTSLPDVIVIDLNLPKLDGRELIEIIKHDYVLSQIPVIILTNSLDDRQLTVSHMLHAKAYIEKPLEVSSLVNALQANPQFGFQITRRYGAAEPA